jgi:hypothetical protein
MMKNYTNYLFYFLMISSANAQQRERGIGYTNWLSNWTNLNLIKHNTGLVKYGLAGTISTSTKLYKRNVYLIQGNVYVTNNAVLTIEPERLL